MVLIGFKGPYGLVWVHCLDTEYHPLLFPSHVTVSLRLQDRPDLPTSIVRPSKNQIEAERAETRYIDCLDPYQWQSKNDTLSRYAIEVNVM
jgi:hypothetical protein